MGAILNLKDEATGKFIPVPYLQGSPGPAGTSGVYYGETAPTDENHPLWVKPSGRALVDYIYPVGSVYISMEETSPASKFGGTWERIKDTFLMAAGDSYAAGSTGGNAEIVQTAEQVGNHTHDVRYVYHVGSGSQTWLSVGQGTYAVCYSYEQGDSSMVLVLGNNENTEPMNILNPYKAYYMWERIE